MTLARPRLGRGPVLPERARRRSTGRPPTASSRRARRTARSRRPTSSSAMKKAAEAAGSAFRYDGRARAIPKEESDRRAAAGEKFVVRLAMPDEPIVVDDVVQGRAEFPAGALDDFVLVRSDGHPLYHFTVCVDDVAMGITHVIRGVDHLPNTPKHVALFRAPRRRPARLRAPRDDPRRRRQEALASATARRASRSSEAQGYLPEALVNFLALLGWSPGEDRERMTLDEMVSLFSLERIGPSPSRFDHEKLAWLNGQYLQEVPTARLLELLRPFGVPGPRPGAPRAARSRCIARARGRSSSSRAALAIYGDDPTDFDAGRPEEVRQAGRARRSCARSPSACRPSSRSPTRRSRRPPARLAAETGLKLGDLAQPARLALTGTLASPPLFELIEVLGQGDDPAAPPGLRGPPRESSLPHTEETMDDATQSRAPDSRQGLHPRDRRRGPDARESTAAASRRASRPSRTATSTSATPSRSA